MTEPGRQVFADGGGDLLWGARDRNLDSHSNISPHEGDINSAASTEDRFFERRAESAFLAGPAGKILTELVLQATAPRQLTGRAVSAVRAGERFGHPDRNRRSRICFP